MITTADLLAELQAAPPVPADSVERSAVEQVKTLAISKLSPLDAKDVGCALMHAMSLHDNVMLALRESDPVLDWESLATLAHNIIGVAGMELYTGTVLGDTPALEGK